MDPLSDVVSLLRVQSALSSRLETRGDWALDFPASHHIFFGAVLEGAAWLVVGDDARALKIAAGDCYLITAELPWRVASNLRLDPSDGPSVMAVQGPDGIVRHGSGKKNFVGVNGRFRLDDDSSDTLLHFLPPLIHLPAGSVREGPLRSAFELIRFETEAIRPGAGAVASSLAMIVLVHILRVYLDNCILQPNGWLGAIADSRVGAALTLMHGDIARHWKVEDLAAAVGMSRAAFAERFKSLVGLPPLDYLTRWRMAVARDALRSDKSLSAIAASVGYASDSAFNIAFKRATGHSPGWYRIKNNVS